MKCYGPKPEGLKVEVNCEDADSSSAKGFRLSYSSEQESRIMFVGVLVRVSSKMQSETTIVPWSMLETAQTNTDKLCWPLESTTVEIFTNGRGVPAAFIH